MFKVKVITFFSGEKSLSILKRSLLKQEQVEIDHVVLTDLNLEEANNQFFRIYLKTGNEFDFIIKVDADMLPINKNAIFKACSIMDLLKLNRLTLPVMDFHTKSKIFGIHFLSNNKECKKIIEDLNPKTDIWISNLSGKTLTRDSDIFFYHGCLPTEMQILRFGFQRGSKLYRSNYSHNHWIIAQKILNNFKKSNKRKNFISLFGLLIGLGYFDDVNPNFKERAYFNENSDNFLKLIDDKRVYNKIRLFKKKWFLFPSDINFFDKPIFILLLKMQTMKVFLGEFLKER